MRMPALHPDLRRRLEKDIIRARQLPRKGWTAALNLLVVAVARPVVTGNSFPAFLFGLQSASNCGICG